jgi:hypothetical protein
MADDGRCPISRYTHHFLVDLIFATSWGNLRSANDTLFTSQTLFSPTVNVNYFILLFPPYQKDSK